MLSKNVGTEIEKTYADLWHHNRYRHALIIWSRESSKYPRARNHWATEFQSYDPDDLTFEN